MESPKFRRPSFSPFPFTLLIVGLAIWWLAGCQPPSGGVVELTAVSQHDAHEQARLAAQSIQEGDQRAADEAAQEGVRLLGGGTGAVAMMGKELVTVGVPAYAARFLATTAQDETMAKDPLLWVALAQAQSAAGDTIQAGRAEEQADSRAAEILRRAAAVPDSLASPPSYPPDEVLNRVTRFWQAGRYYSEVKGDPQKAFTVLRAAYRLLPDSAFTLNELGYTLADKGSTPEEFREALELTKRAAEKEPENGNILDSYGWALFKNNELKGAQSVLLDAIDKSPEVPELHYHLGVVFAELGDHNSARIEFDRALRLNPEYKDAERAKAKIGEQ